MTYDEAIDRMIAAYGVVWDEWTGGIDASNAQSVRESAIREAARAIGLREMMEALVELPNAIERQLAGHGRGIEPSERVQIAIATARRLARHD